MAHGHKGRFTTLLSTTDVANTTTTNKTFIQWQAGLGVRLRIRNLSISCAGATSTTYYKIRILRQTTSGTLDGGAGTIVPVLLEDTQAFLSTFTVGKATGANTAEPTAGAVLKTLILPSVNGYYERDFDDDELVTGFGVTAPNAAGRIGLEITPTASDSNIVRIDGVLEE